MTKTNKQIQDNLMKNLIKCLNTNASFSQVSQAFSQALGTKPTTKTFKTPNNTCKPNKINQNKKNKA